MGNLYRLCTCVLVFCSVAFNMQAQNLATPVSLGTAQNFKDGLQAQMKAAAAQKGGTPSISQKVSANKSFSLKVNYKQAIASNDLIMGEVEGVAGSSFVINAGEQSLEGHIILTSTKKAYKYYSENGNAYIKEVDINTLICVDYEHKPSKNQKQSSNTKEAIAPALLNLQSLPGAPGCVLLDFDGYFMPAGNYWNNGNSINAAPSGMSDADVQQHFDVVAEDYRPFNVNITTSESVFNSYPRNRRMRVVITPTNTAAPGAGGVAYIGSFNWDNDVPCWVFITSGKSGGDASSHEIGHCFDLQHDGRSNPNEGYFLGIDGTAWAPIMGAGYYRPIVQWSKGEYRYAKNDQPGVLQDDIAVIASSKFGVGFRPDDYGNNTGSAATLDYNASGAINQKAGVIHNEGDWDFFTFQTGGGNVIINARTVSRDQNLHIIIRLYNSAGAEIGSAYDPNTFNMNASLNVNLAAGRYYVSIDGAGAGDPAYGGYSAYGSLGSYWITGTIPPGGSVNPTTGLVTVYKDCNYSGFSAGLEVGDYTFAQLQAKGVLNDDISSLRIMQGFKAIVYADDNFTGASTTFTADMGCSAEWNDRITSIRIRPNGDPNLSGIYVILNRHSNLALDVNGGTGAVADGAGFIQSNPHENTNQQFRFEHVGDGAYKVVAIHSGKVMDIDGIKKDNGAKVQQWTYLGSFNQEFIAVSTGDGFYKLIAKHSGKVVEVGGWSTTSGAAVQQWDNNNQASGMWKLNRPAAANGNGDGLAGSYFNGMNFETARFARKDGTVNFDWGTGSPNAAVNADQFSVRWTGQVQPRYHGTYTFYVTNDDGGRLWVNNQLIVDKWRNDGGTEVSGTIVLQKGVKYDIKLEYFENGGGAKAKLEWSSPIQARQVVPTAQLFSNPVPTVSITAPSNNANFTAPASFTANVNASDNGSIDKVEIYNGNTLVVTENDAPYTANFSNLAAGTYTLKAIAFDNSGAFTISSNVTVTVVNDPLAGNGDGLSANYFNGMNFEVPRYSGKDATLNMNWGNGAPNAAVNADNFSARWTGQIQPKYSGEYTFYINSDNGRRVWIDGQLIIDEWVDNWGTDFTGTINLTAGQKYDIKVELFENVGGANIKFEWSSAQQARQVVPTSQLYSNPLPTVSVSSSATTAIAPANIILTATASDANGIAKVDFYNGTTLLGSDNTAPYSFAWNNVAIGTYSVTAVATDTKGGVTVSSAVSVKVNSAVNQAPTVGLTGPANNSTYNAPANITISANAADADGSVASVAFYNGTSLIGTDNTAPYSVTWSGVGAGTYSITARVTDNQGAVTNSSAITVKVNQVVTNTCSGITQYSENAGYVAGSVVQNSGSKYECKPWPYSGWCNGAAWAYAPGTGMYWTDAWTLIGSCTSAKTANADYTNLFAPNPTTGVIMINLTTASKISVYNTLGTEVMPATEVSANGQIDLSNLASGMYLLKIDTGSEVITQSIIKK